MNYDGPDRRRDRDNLPARVASVETWQDMHGRECERRYGELNEKTDEIKDGVKTGNAKMERMEKRLLYSLLGIAGLFVWEYFIKRLYLG
jgi:hypothetical protein